MAPRIHPGVLEGEFLLDWVATKIFTIKKVFVYQKTLLIISYG